MRTLRASDHPRFSSPCRNAARRVLISGSSSAKAVSTPIRRIRSGCCARAPTGHDAAAPPSAASNSRRPMVTVIRPSRARCVKATVSRHERRVFFTFKERAETARGAVTRYARGSALLELDVGRPDHLAPLLGFFANESSKFVRRGWKCRRTQLGDPSLDPGIAKRRVDLLVEFMDDFGRCVLRSAEATPSAGLVPRQKVGNGWDIR